MTIHEAPAAPEKEVSEPQPAMVLLVDDQLMIGEAVRRALKGEADINFHFCLDPEQAIEIAQQISPTVILQDLVMPGTDGLTLVRAYRALKGTEQVPIIVLSSREEAKTKSDAFAGCHEMLTWESPSRGVQRSGGLPSRITRLSKVIASAYRRRRLAAF